eukprot:CAMPEP_0183358816 /NCGR_PEP_ID=MMETSP0164_2-20130417/50380_1 /TAXON_ID=221442 /ORGANISM="Coccolithus pelagicus ssp braarudi, Strain PLY182g" /LENGTH=65 /DNA_ID=CAMNT_0025532787 /DNA_START=743 /DNA_END=940 /DNA_ORIENTATION=-
MKVSLLNCGGAEQLRVSLDMFCQPRPSRADDARPWPENMAPMATRTSSVASTTVLSGRCLRKSPT